MWSSLRASAFDVVDDFDSEDRRLFHRRVYSVLMSWCERFVLLAFIVVFSAGVVCSVICPERPIVPDKGQQEKGPCTDCTSTDFTSGAKVSIEKASLNAAAGLELNWFLAPVSCYASPMIFVSKEELFEPSPPLVTSYSVLRV